MHQRKSNVNFPAEYISIDVSASIYERDRSLFWITFLEFLRCHGDSVLTARIDFDDHLSNRHYFMECITLMPLLKKMDIECLPAHQETRGLQLIPRLESLRIGTFVSAAAATSILNCTVPPQKIKSLTLGNFTQNMVHILTPLFHPCKV